MISVPVAWAALGVALLLLGRPGTTAGQGAGSPAARRFGDPVRTGAVAGGCVAVAAVLAGGLPGTVAAAVLAPAVGFVVTRAAVHRAGGRRDPSLPVVLDLVSAALEAGQPLPRALELASAAAAPPLAGELRRIARLLALGAGPEEVWREASPALLAVGLAARRSARSGARLARNLSALAADLRAGDRASALARAHRAGVLALLPLGLCFLPAFVCLGIVPSVAGLLSGVLSGAP